MSPKIFTLLLILVPTFLYYGFYRPLYDGVPGLVWTPEHSLIALQSENASLQNALDQIATVETGAKKLNEEYLTISPEAKEKAMIMLPEDIDKIKLAHEIKTIADQTGVSVGTVSILQDSKPAGKNLGSYSATISLKARYPLFLKLMQNYEKNMRFFVIESMTIKHPENGEGDTGNGLFDKEVLAIGLTFKVYYLKP